MVFKIKPAAMHHPLKCIAKDNNGFTLIELLTVLVIVAILAAVSAPIYMNYIKGARAADAQTTIAAINTAEKIYYQKTGNYATNVDDLEKNKDITIDEATKNKWSFTVEASGEIYTGASAVSKEEMAGGAGHTIRFDVKEGKFHGYGIDE
jgi:prepilin-type N-terminal cleavage/methylation domain-containing protein